MNYNGETTTSYRRFHCRKSISLVRAECSPMDLWALMHWSSSIQGPIKYMFYIEKDIALHECVFDSYIDYNGNQNGNGSVC